MNRFLGEECNWIITLLFPSSCTMARKHVQLLAMIFESHCAYFHSRSSKKNAMIRTKNSPQQAKFAREKGNIYWSPSCFWGIHWRMEKLKIVPMPMRPSADADSRVFPLPLRSSNLKLWFFRFFGRKISAPRCLNGTGIFTYIYHKFMINVGKYPYTFSSVG